MSASQYTHGVVRPLFVVLGLAGLGCAGTGDARSPGPHAGSQAEANRDAEREVIKQLALPTELMALGEAGGTMVERCGETEVGWSFTLLEEELVGQVMQDAEDPSQALRDAFASAVGGSRTHALEGCLPSSPKLGFAASFSRDGRVRVFSGSSLEENKYHPPRRLTDEQRGCVDAALSGRWFPPGFFEGEAVGLATFETSREGCTGGGADARDYADGVEISVVSVDGALDAGSVARSLERRVDDLGACYFQDEGGVPVDRDEPRVLDVRFAVNEGGQTVMPEIVGIDEPTTARCLAITIVRTRFSSSDPRSEIRLRIAFEGDDE